MLKTRANGVELSYDIQGEGSPLLFICGTGVTHKSWDQMVPFFRDTNKCILYDNRGTGESEFPPDGYSVETMAEDAMALLRSVDACPSTLMGWSVGTLIAMEMAIRYPDTVNALILIGTCDRSYPHMRRRVDIQIELAKLNQKGLLAAYSILHLFSPQFINERESDVQQFQDEILSAPNRPPMDLMIKHYELGFAYFSKIADDRFSQIKSPTLITVGSEDPLTRPEYGESLHKKIPNSEFVVLPGADHMMPVFQASHLSRVIHGFLTRQGIKA